MTNNKIKPPITKSQSNKVAQKYKISSVETKKNDCPEHSVEDKNLVKITQGSA